MTINSRGCHHLFFLPAFMNMTSNVALGIGFDRTSYSRTASLLEADDNTLGIHWTVDVKRGTLRLAVHAKAVTGGGGGWVGFGIAEMGGMEGSDIFFYEVESGNITDAYSLVAGTPVRDTCQQDWDLVAAEIGVDGLVVETERFLDTSDPQDRVLMDDSASGAQPTRVIAAWGHEATVSYHGTSRRAKGAVVFFGDGDDGDTAPGDFSTSSGGGVGVGPAAENKSANTPWFDVAPSDFEIPANKTTYHETCVRHADLPAGGNFHAVGFRRAVQQEQVNFVHHLVLRGFFNDDCDSSALDFAYVYAWAPGALDEFSLPEDVGFRFGFGDGGFRSLGVQTHYNNPAREAGRRDSSGVCVSYVTDLRAMDAGMMSIGDPNLLLAGTPLREGKSRYSFSCPSSCFTQHFRNDSVTVAAHLLHMHETGRDMETRQYRDGELVGKSTVEYYSFDQAGGFVITPLAGSEVIRRGDSLVTECQYDTSDAPEQPVMFGFGSRDEMPIPRIGFCGIGFCGGEMVEHALLSEGSNFGRSFGSDSCHEGPPEEVIFLTLGSSPRYHRLFFYCAVAGFAVVVALSFKRMEIMVEFIARAGWGSYAPTTATTTCYEDSDSRRATG